MDISPDNPQSLGNKNPTSELHNKVITSLTNSASASYNDPNAPISGGGMEPINPMMAPQKPNPACEDSLCGPSFWVTERKLCLFSYKYNGSLCISHGDIVLIVTFSIPKISRYIFRISHSSLQTKFS